METMNIPLVKRLLSTDKQDSLYEFLSIKQEMYEFLSDWTVRGVTSFLILKETRINRTNFNL